ncbi:helix-turn-helix domain-containing protein [Actinomadura decatromicini]|uniref:Helix-turn-helix transcriptional regulator n=1 Tax=Actinomadura decatromicini TaxID=2604572 RepID=A0A5D3FGU7_9ACTN|nr:helix-turn-helix transcriptional regulator [Actinomadura decatromicini]
MPLDARRTSCDAPCMPTNDLRAEWGRRLAQARAAAELSIRELARRTGIHPSHLARFESGDAGLGDANRMAVATAVGQAVTALFPYPDPTPKDTAPCPSADTATAAQRSRTRRTRAATRSPAPSAEVPAASAPVGSPGND